MSIPVLVAYATRYGSTQEVAEKIAATLRENGLPIDLQPMNKIATLDGYSAVVLGAPVFIGSWHKDARAFLDLHRVNLMKRPVAIFALGPLHADEMQGSRQEFDAELAKYDWLKPVSVEMFVGKYDPAVLRFPDKLLTIIPSSPLHNRPASDERDWAAITTWATKLVTMLQHEVA